MFFNVKFKFQHLLFLVFFSLLNLSSSYAEGGRDNEEQLQIVNVETYLPTSKQTLEEVLSNARFEPVNVSNLEDINYGLKCNPIWLKFNLRNKTNAQGQNFIYIRNANLRVVNLYEVKNGEVIKFHKLGTILPFKQRSYLTPAFIFPLDNGQVDTTIIYYIEAKSNAPLFVPLEVINSEKMFYSISRISSIAFAFLGILIVMILYNFFIAISTNDRAYYLYIIYLIFLGLTQLSVMGFTYMLFWPQWPGFNRHAIILFSSLGGIYAILFANNFLKLERNKIKWIIYLSYFIILIFVVTIIVEFILPNSRSAFYMMQVATALASLTYLGVSLYLFKNDVNARFFFFAWFIFILSSLIFIMKDYGFVPRTLFIENIVLIGATIEIILLSLGLADRINFLRKQRDEARLLQLREVQKNQKIVKEQNLFLNDRVKQRTEELENTNGELQRVLNNLQQTQMQLVESEKMSSLGQLTAGIAHEINNPINFVSANVKPLTRDISQLYEAINTIEEICMQEKPKEDKIKLLEEYKEEIEHDFIKIEISQLLKGIQEGADRTAEIVKGLRTFSRVDEDTYKSSDINENLRSTLAILANKMRGITLEKDLGDIPDVVCYPGKLNQVFLNLIVNAIYAIHKRHGNDVDGMLTVKTWREDDYVVVLIKDDGIGMNDETLKKIFEPFFTTKPVGEGTGLGMSISFNILKMHKAQYDIKSKLGEGTEFLVKLPINPIE